jgi:hypothetical protein
MSDLHPNWISGFVDGEGCFSVSFTKRNGWIEVRPSFSISQSGKRFCEALEALNAYFGCGGIRYSKIDGTYKYEVRSLEDLQTRILPHFEKYPLVSVKRDDWKKLCRICELMKRNLHKNEKGILEIIDIAYSMNPSGKRKYTKEELLKSIGS